MSQTSYSRSFSGAFSGMLSDSGDNRIESVLNDQGADVPAGVMMQASAEGKAKLPSLATDALLGVSVHSFARDPDDLSGTAAIKDNRQFDVLTKGSIFVAVEETVAAGDPVYCRITSDGGDNTQLGRFRNDSDSGRCRLVKGARFVKGGTTSTPAELYFDVAAANAQGDQVEIVIDHAQVTGDTTSVEWKNKSDRHFIMDEAWIYNATGLAEDASNTFNIKLLNATQSNAIMAKFDTTATTGEGTLTAATWMQMTNGTSALRTMAPGDSMALFLDETGTATLPAGKVVVKGHYA